MSRRMLTVSGHSGFWMPAAILAAGLFLSLHIETLVHPRCPGIRRPWPAAALHSGLVLLCLALTLALTKRPLFALLLVLAGQLLVTQVSNAKYRALREPFIFSDFGIFSQTIKHPRLYLPFLGLPRAIIIGVAAAGAIVIGLALEHPLGNSVMVSALLAGVGSVALLAGAASLREPSLEPEKDVARQGLFATVWQYWLREKTRPPRQETNLPSIRSGAGLLPDIIVIQSESFFDPRKIYPGIRHDLLQHFDEACAAATLHGKLTVPTWGANTMRPEFAFLTGITPAALDVHRFNPYRRIARRPMRALPAVLREAGFTTTCIHPHPARFFRRDLAFPNLGFERFIDHRGFTGADRCGPYVSDEAVTDKLIHEIQNAAGPAFFFVITMENHGPLHLERVAREEREQFYNHAPPENCGDLSAYLRHLRNADQQLGRLRAVLATRSKPFILCFYGEHIPSMPSVYDTLGAPDGRTDYFLHIADNQSRVRDDLMIHKLAFELLRHL